MTKPMAKTTLIKGNPIREEYGGSGGYSGEDTEEDINFMKSVLDNKFPTGYFVVDGFADFYIINELINNREFNIKGNTEMVLLHQKKQEISILVYVNITHVKSTK